MNMLTAGVKDFVMEFRSDNKYSPPRRSIRLARYQAEAMNKVLKRGVKYIELHDEKGNYIETLETRSIKGIKLFGANEEQASTRSAVCDYGTRHPHMGKEGFEECECRKKFSGLLGFQYRNILDKHFPGVEYSSDITPEMRVKMIDICRKIKK